MFDPENPLPVAPPPKPTGFRMNWWMLGLAGLAALVLAAYIKPQPVTATSATTVTATKPAAAAPRLTTSPETVSLTDTAAKAAVGLLLVYVAGWGLVKLRRRGMWPARSGQDFDLERRPRLRLAESLSLGHQRGMLHLVEVDGTTLLLGSAVDQVCLLWTAAADHTTSFKPVAPLEPESDFVPLPPRPATPPRRAGVRPPARPEADWTRERSRLISALLQEDQTAQ